MILPVGSATTYTSGSGGSVSSITINVPTGVSNWDYLTLFIVSQNVTPSATPSGWTLLQSGTTTALSSILCGRIAASEPASYSPTVTTARTTALMRAWSGVDLNTPMDVAASATNGTTATTFGVITPVTPGAYVVAYGAQQFASGVTPGTAATNNMTLDAQVGTSAAAAANVVAAQAYFAWLTGAFTPNMSNGAATARTIGTRIALRPAPEKSRGTRVLQAVNRVGSY